MELPKAKELVGYIDADPGLMRYPDYKDAVKLGAEALTLVELLQNLPGRKQSFMLHGQTERSDNEH